MILAAFARIEEFLAEEEVPDWVSTLKQEDSAATSVQFDPRLGAADAAFEWYRSSQRKKTRTKAAPPASWWRKSPLQLFKKAPATRAPVPETDIEDATFQLYNINIVFPRGELSVVTGPTGSGKSSLLAALLGEMKHLRGTVLLPKSSHRVDPTTGLSESISFCAQHPWLESSAPSLCLCMRCAHFAPATRDYQGEHVRVDSCLTCALLTRLQSVRLAVRCGCRFSIQYDEARLIPSSVTTQSSKPAPSSRT